MALTGAERVARHRQRQKDRIAELEALTGQTAAKREPKGRLSKAEQREKVLRTQLRR